MSETRIEKDSLGEIEVPADALYGAQTMRAVHNFPVSGLRPYRAFVWSMAVIKQAAALVHMDLGLLDEERGQAIVQAAQEVIDGPLGRPVRGRSLPGRRRHQPQHEHQRGDRQPGQPDSWAIAIDDPAKPVHPNDHVNMAQSTNDTIPTAIRLGCLWRLDELTDEVDAPGRRAAATRPASSTTWSSRGAPTCRTPCRCAWARSLAPMPAPSSATPSACAAPPRGCAAWASAGRPPAPASTPTPSTTPAW